MAPKAPPKTSPIAGSALQGTLSAACELGAATIAFRFLLPALDLPSILGFSAGAAAIEALMLVFLENPHASGPNGEFAAAQLALLRSGPPWVLALSVVAERAVATTLHIACRTLVAASALPDRGPSRLRSPYSRPSTE